MQLSSQNLLHASALPQKLLWGGHSALVSAVEQTAAPSVLLFLLMQKHEASLICKTVARESLVSYRTRSDLSFPEREVIPRCSPRHCRQQLESITSDKEQGEQSLLPTGATGKPQRL